MTTRPGEPLEFLRRVIADPPDRCVTWPYSKNSLGYGNLVFDGRLRPAHRVVLILITGDDSEGLEAAHAPIVCHNRACVNPRHLRWATHADNVADRALDGTEADRRGTLNGRAKLTEDQVLEIRSAIARGLRQREIADQFGVSKQLISEIARGNCWRHVLGAA